MDGVKIEGMMKLKYTFECIEIDRQLVMISVEKREEDSYWVIKPNKSAGEILNLLKKSRSKHETEVRLRQHYDGPWELLKTDVDTFLERLCALGLLVMDGNCAQEAEGTGEKEKESFSEKQRWMKPEIEVIRYQENAGENCGSTGHAHCKSPFGRDYSHE